MKRRFRSIITICLVASALCAGAAMHSDETGHEANVARNLRVFNKIVRELEAAYVDSIRTDEAFAEAIDAMLATVDPYTQYFNSEETEQLNTMTTGEYGGIGSYVTFHKGYTRISEPHLNSPAAEAGLMAGDAILAVDSVDTKGMHTEKVVKLLKGQPGTELTIKVGRPYIGEDSIRHITLTRRKLQLPSVPYYGILEDGRTAYVALTSFNENSANEVRKAIEALKADPRTDALILDLRGNGGGLLESAIDIVGNFVPKGTPVVTTKYRDNRGEKVFKTTHSPLIDANMPMAVLINGGSASAAEITAGALQDLDRAVLVGNRSFGKGLVQSTIPILNDGVLKVTVAKYYIPSGRLIQAIDYAKRDEEGNIISVPDSLLREFKTRNGRIVKEGAGLMPDSVIAPKSYSSLLRAIMGNQYVFDYSTKFRAEHPEIAPPAEFVVTDDIYEDFKEFVAPIGEEYIQGGKKFTEKLSETFKEEGYDNEETDALLERLGDALTRDLDADLDRIRPDLDRFLGSEIVTRYYYMPGTMQYSLRFDDEVKQAAEILHDKALYNKILNK